MQAEPNVPTIEARRPYWRETVESYERPHTGRSIAQISTSILPYFVCWAAMLLALRVSYLLTLAISVLAAGFLVRSFIVFHDCAHSSFFKKRKLNDWVGRSCGVLVFTPFLQWRHEHAMHHASAGDLDRRGTGDIHTLTLSEYQQLSRRGKLVYRIYRNPVVMFGIAPVIFQLVAQRFPASDARRRDRYSVHGTTLTMIAVAAAMMWIFGPLPFVAIMVPVAVWSSAAGIWLFYVQHQFEEAYWQTSDKWDYADAALQGSSYLKLPKILQWFTGNIGLHHIHHLSSRIPNYRLQRCHDENELFQSVPTMSFLDGLKATRLKLWDEKNNRMVGWKALRKPIAA